MPKNRSELAAVIEALIARLDDADPDCEWQKPLDYREAIRIKGAVANQIVAVLSGRKRRVQLVGVSNHG